MTREEAIAKHKEHCDRLHQMYITKNSDYAGGSADPFECFKRSAEGANITVEEGIDWEISKKITRLSSLIKGDTPNHESIFDNASDLLNYLIIKDIYLTEKE